MTPKEFFIWTVVVGFAGLVAVLLILLLGVTVEAIRSV
jgi:hypothetical protein